MTDDGDRVIADEEQGAGREKAMIEATIKSERRAVLIVNTLSRQGQRFYSAVKRLLVDNGITLEAAYPVRDPARLPEVVQDAVARGHQFIILGGGDGTISSVVDYFAYKKVVLGILPLGTANSFARTLGIPLDVEAAVGMLLAGKVADVDLGKINDDYFANGAAIGLAASIARSMPKHLKQRLGRVGYLLVAVARLLRHKSFRCILTHEGNELAVDALEVRVANGGYQGGVLVAEEASIESRDLVIHIIRGTSKWTLVKVWARVSWGMRPRPEDLTILRTRDLVIKTEPKQYVSIDGEAVTQTPIRVTVAREALLIMVPRNRDDLV